MYHWPQEIVSLPHCSPNDLGEYTKKIPLEKREDKKKQESRDLVYISWYVLHTKLRQSTSTKHTTILALCEGNPPVTSGYPSQSACNANVLKKERLSQTIGILYIVMMVNFVTSLFKNRQYPIEWLWIEGLHRLSYIFSIGVCAPRDRKC